MGEIVVTYDLVLSCNMTQKTTHRLSLKTLLTIRVFVQYLQTEIYDTAYRMAQGTKTQFLHFKSLRLLLGWYGPFGKSDFIHEILFGNVHKQVFVGLVKIVFPQKRFIIRHLGLLIVEDVFFETVELNFEGAVKILVSFNSQLLTLDAWLPFDF